MRLVETAIECTQGRVSQITLAPWRGQPDLPVADALLLHAYSLHKASLCPCGCGHPAESALDPEAEGSIEVDGSHRCFYRAALDEWREGEGKDAEPGVLPIAVLDEKSYAIAKARAEAARSSAS